MRILIFGASGKLGAAIARQLLRDFPEAEIVGTSRSEQQQGVFPSLMAETELKSDDAGRKHGSYEVENRAFGTEAEGKSGVDAEVEVKSGLDTEVEMKSGIRAEARMKPGSQESTAGSGAFDNAPANPYEAGLATLIPEGDYAHAFKGTPAYQLESRMQSGFSVGEEGIVPNGGNGPDNRSGSPQPDAGSNTIQWIQFDPWQDDWALLGRADVWINTIGAIRLRKKSDFEVVHEGFIQKMLDHYRKAGSPRMIQLSALGADPDHKVPFLSTKAKADAALLAQVPDALVLRPSIVCTPNTMLFQKLGKLIQTSRFTFSKLLVPKGFLSTRVQPVAIEDLTALVSREVLTGASTGILEVAGPEPFSFETLLKWRGEAMGAKPRFIEVPRDFIDGFVRYFMSVWFPGVINYDQFQLLFQDNVADTTAFEHALGRPLRSTNAFWQQSARQ